MDLNLAFLAFCLTLVALVALSRDKDKLAHSAIGALMRISGQMTRKGKK